MVRLALVVAAVSIFSLSAQTPPAPGGGRGRGPQNLKILKPEQLRDAMASFVVATGLTCDGCHVLGDRASDAKTEKVTARRMIEMVQGINASNFNGEMKVTCYTCHHGDAHPLTAAPPKQ